MLSMFLDYLSPHSQIQLFGGRRLPNSFLLALHINVFTTVQARIAPTETLGFDYDSRHYDSKSHSGNFYRYAHSSGLLSGKAL